jgi:hypothetical protein
MALVSDGCIAHVCLGLDTPDVMAAHDGKYYQLVEKVSKANGGSIAKAVAAEEAEYERVQAAQNKIIEKVVIAMRTLLTLQKLPEMIAADDKLEVRLLLCHRINPLS